MKRWTSAAEIDLKRSEAYEENCIIRFDQIGTAACIFTLCFTMCNKQVKFACCKYLLYTWQTAMLCLCLANSNVCCDNESKYHAWLDDFFTVSIYARHGTWWVCVRVYVRNYQLKTLFIQSKPPKIDKTIEFRSSIIHLAEHLFLWKSWLIWF